MLSRIVAATAAALVLLSAPIAGAAPAAAAPVRELGGASAPVAKQQVFWRWSDGSQKTTRLFREARYQRAGRLPKLIVTAVPAKPSRAVVLQFQQKGKWLIETTTSTNAKGIATMKLNPYCTNNTWCDGTWTYRIKVGTLYQVVKVTYAGK